MALRDDLLPVIDLGGQLAAEFGLSRFVVTIRRRVWGGNYVGDGTPVNQDLVLSPAPRVKDAFSPASLRPEALQYLLANGGITSERLYKIDNITPAYVDNGVAGGYTPQQLRLRPSPDSKNVEGLVILVGDDGYKRECTQLAFEQDHAFGYSMIVHETNRPRVALASLAITPGAPSVAHGSTLQLVATGTFADAGTSDLSPLVVWSSSDPTKATVDVLGKLTALAAGTTTITAMQTGITTTTLVTVT